MSKQSRLPKKKDELPSFLVGITDPPEDIDFPTRPKQSFHYLGPIFFGKCSGYQHHAPPHSLKLGSFHQPHYSMLPAAENISNLLLPLPKIEKQTPVLRAIRPRVKHRKVYTDPYLHRAPGRNKVFRQDNKPHVVNLGQTESIIEGEMSMEIPLRRLHNVTARRYKKKPGLRPEIEIVTLSDIREENWIYLPYKERIAHAHYPKEFTTVRLIGPTIPASLTITKLPSKRKTQSELAFELKSKPKEAGPAKEPEKPKEEKEKKISVKATKSVPSEEKRRQKKTIETIDEAFDEYYGDFEESEYTLADEEMLENEGEEYEDEEEEELEGEGLEIEEDVILEEAENEESEGSVENGEFREGSESNPKWVDE